MDIVDVFLYDGDPIALLRLREFEKELAAVEASKESLTWENERLQNELYITKRELAIRAALCDSIVKSVRDNPATASAWDPAKIEDKVRAIVYAERAECPFCSKALKKDKRKCFYCHWDGRPKSP